MRLLAAAIIAILYLALLYLGVVLGLVAILSGAIMLYRAPVLDAGPSNGLVSARSEGRSLIGVGVFLAAIAGVLDYWHFIS